MWRAFFPESALHLVLSDQPLNPGYPGKAKEGEGAGQITLYVCKAPGFRGFREKDENGEWKQIKEAALVYSFESFIQTLLQVVEGKSYLEPYSGLGRSDLIINIEGKETVIEFKIYRDQARFEKGKRQVAHYSKSLSVDECVYLVFVPDVYRELGMKDEVLTINGVTVRCYIIFYDQTKDF